MGVGKGGGLLSRQIPDWVFEEVEAFFRRLQGQDISREVMNNIFMDEFKKWQFLSSNRDFSLGAWFGILEFH